MITDVHDPDGNIIQVEHPEGATQAEIIEYARVSVEGVDYDVTKSLDNLGSSGAQFAQDMWEGVKSVGDAASVGLSRSVQKMTGLEDDAERLNTPRRTPALQQVMSGIAQKVSGLGDEAQAADIPTSAGVVDAMSDYYGDRYGGIDEIKTTAMEDPVGMLSDVAGVATLGTGAAAKATSQLPKVSRALEQARKVASAVDPATLPTHALNLAPTNAMYREGLKVEGRDFQDIYGTTETALDTRATVDQKGLDRVRAALNKTGDELTKELKKTPDIDINEVIQHVPDLKKKRGSITESATPGADTAAIDKVFSETMLSLATEFPGLKIPAADANRLKKAFYRAGAAGFGDPTPTAILDVYKAIARGAKEGIEAANPRVSEINAQLGKLGNIKDSITPNAMRQAGGLSSGVNFPVRTATGSVGMGALASFAGRQMANVAVYTRWLRENPANLVVARSALVQSGRTKEEAERILIQDLIEDES